MLFRSARPRGAGRPGGPGEGRWKLQLSERAEFQYSQRELDTTDVFLTRSSRGNQVCCMYIRCAPNARYLHVTPVYVCMTSVVGFGGTESRQTGFQTSCSLFLSPPPSPPPLYLPSVCFPYILFPSLPEPTSSSQDSELPALLPDPSCPTAACSAVLSVCVCVCERERNTHTHRDGERAATFIRADGSSACSACPSLQVHGPVLSRERCGPGPDEQLLPGPGLPD